MIWRDDDVLRSPASLPAFRAVCDLLQQFDQVHTVACIAETLTPELGAELRSRRVDVQLHCWSHIDLSIAEDPTPDLARGLDRIEALVGTRPSTLYPPWNRTSATLEAAAATLGLIVSAEKISLAQYIRVRGHVAERVLNFHYWEPTDRQRLAEALEVHRAWAASR